MSIFRRGAGGRAGRGGREAAGEPDPTAPETDAPEEPDETATAGRAPADLEPVALLPDRTAGPWDRTEVGGPDGRLDLGSLWIPGVPGMELRLEIDETGAQVVAVNIALAGSAVHLQAFAAPRSEGVWADIRGEIAAGITRAGGTAQDVAGPLGPELRARMPVAGPGGRVGYAPTRFVGVDGPRWFLRAVLSGPAADDEAAARPLLELVREVVVVRGSEAMAPRDLLPLHLPEEAVDVPADGSAGPLEDAAAEDDGADEAADGDAAGRLGGPGRRSLDELRPFERGPEITEIR